MIELKLRFCITSFSLILKCFFQLELQNFENYLIDLTHFLSIISFVYKEYIHELLNPI